MNDAKRTEGRVRLKSILLPGQINYLATMICLAKLRASSPREIKILVGPRVSQASNSYTFQHYPQACATGLGTWACIRIKTNF